MNRMIGFGRGLHLVDDLAQPLLELALHAGAGLQQPDVERAAADTSFSGGGTSPRAMRSAKPSTTAVLPTPASPVRIGLFWRRRIRMSMIWRISSSRPVTGSISPSRARAVRSTRELRQRLLLAHRRRRHGTAALAGLAAAAGREPDPSCAPSIASGDAAADLGEVLGQVSSLMLRTGARSASSTLRRLLASCSMPITQVAGAHLRLAEHQRAVHPAASRCCPRCARKSR